MRMLIGLAVIGASLAPAAADEARYFDNVKLLECIVGRAATLVWVGADASDAFMEVRDNCLAETAVTVLESGVDYVGPEPALRAANDMIHAIGAFAESEGFE